MKAFLKVLGHAALGGVAVALAEWAEGGGPFTLEHLVLPVLASALSSVISLFSRRPRIAK